MSLGRYEIIRVTAGDIRKDQDRLAPEEPLEVCVQPHQQAEIPLAVTMRTPGDDVNLAVGFLRGEGIVVRREDVASCGMAGDPSPDTGTQNRVVVRLAPHVNFDLESVRRNFYATSSCGICGKATLDSLNLMGASPATHTMGLSAGALQRLPAALVAHQDQFMETGGVHAAASFNESGDIVDVREDVGRHNALDKLLGAAFIGDAASAPGVLVSGRASFELIQKCAMSGVEALAAVGAPSSLAVDAARRFNITLVGFLTDSRFNVYTGDERIDGIGR